MFNNLVNRHDFARTLRVLRSGRLRSLTTKLRGSEQLRVIRQFDVDHARSSQWWDAPHVQRRWHGLITGEPNRDRIEYLVAEHLGDATELRGLSPACGTGRRERRWAETGRFSRIDGFDLNDSCINQARSDARTAGLDSILNFQVRDIGTLSELVEPYDVIIAEHSLHHFSRVSRVLKDLAKLLLPSGWLFIDEYVGPTRFQWTKRQLEAVNALLMLIPERYRRTQDGSIKKRIHRPSILSMIVDDPSEAIESSEILPALREHFEILEFKPYGGTLLQLVLSGIAHNFVEDEPEALEVLELCFRAEDALLRSGELDSDFVVAACRPRTGKIDRTA